MTKEEWVEFNQLVRQLMKQIRRESTCFIEQYYLVDPKTRCITFFSRQKSMPSNFSSLCKLAETQSVTLKMGNYNSYPTTFRG